MLLLALLAGFFAWTSAEPFWLAVGHAEHGTAKVTTCKGSGVLRRCMANFTGPESDADGVTLVGVEERPGAEVETRMVPGGRIAYGGSDQGLHARWAVGLMLVLCCGLVLAWFTDAGRLPTSGGRAGALALTFTAPLALAIGIVAATY